jgi:hypothetical protein
MDILYSFSLGITTKYHESTTPAISALATTPNAGLIRPKLYATKSVYDDARCGGRYDDDGPISSDANVILI